MNQNASAFGLRPSAFRAWWVLVLLSFQRHWRLRQMGWVATGLLAVCVVLVAALTARPGGWGLPERSFRRGLTYRAVSEQLLLPGRYENPNIAREGPSPLDPTRDALGSLLLAIPHAVMRSERFVADWAFMTYSRWVVSVLYLGFILPLFTLAYASGAFGTERESRTLVWVMTRPIPRWAIYLAKFVGTLPWCVVFALGGFVALGLAGGPQGRIALGMYWPAAVMGTVALSALFHLIGAVFRRPVVVGLVYVFFFELLVALLPGSLKLLSLTFYIRSLLYNAATAAGYPSGMLNVPGAVSETTAWAVLVSATVGLTGLGMWLFARGEHRDDI